MLLKAILAFSALVITLSNFNEIGKFRVKDCVESSDELGDRDLRIIVRVIGKTEEKYEVDYYYPYINKWSTDNGGNYKSTWNIETFDLRFRKTECPK